MTIVLQVRDSDRYTFWNVTKVEMTENEIIINHSDRPVRKIEGKTESIKVRG